MSYDTKQQLKYALEGLEQINQAYEDGEYWDTMHYLRDIEAQSVVIDRLEKKLNERNKQDVKQS